MKIFRQISVGEKYSYLKVKAKINRGLIVVLSTLVCLIIGLVGWLV